MPKGGPTSHIYFSQRLRLHYVDWGNEDAPALLMVHGGRDHCRNWDWVADELRHDYHIIAPDLRGHGDSQWMLGGSYTIIDYVYDIAQLLHQTHTTPTTIIGHSLGGSVSLLYSGIYPENVTKLISIEGMRPPPGMFDKYRKTDPHARLEAWIGNLRQLSGRMPKLYPSLEDAFQRMQTENPHLSEVQARHLTIHGSNQNEDGSYSWKFDNYVRAFAPIGLSPEETWKIHARIDCPLLLINGAESWASNPQDDGRAEAFGNSSVVEIDGAGHWVHHDQLEQFLHIAREFLVS